MRTLVTLLMALSCALYAPSAWSCDGCGAPGGLVCNEPDVAPWSCTIDSDCAGGPCVVGVCDEGACQYPYALLDGSPCDDGGSCYAGACCNSPLNACEAPALVATRCKTDDDCGASGGLGCTVGVCSAGVCTYPYAVLDGTPCPEYPWGTECMAGACCPAE